MREGHLLTVQVTRNIIAKYHIRGESFPLLLRHQNMEAVMGAHMADLTLHQNTEAVMGAHMADLTLHQNMEAVTRAHMANLTLYFSDSQPAT